MRNIVRADLDFSMYSTAIVWRSFENF